jgi:BirA family transcriptional regulator, biotin operon repressor / biotin---[acetyl-CoA-carboxylase] ligase
LHADDLISRLGKTKVIGRDIRVFQETTSTNDVIEKLAHDGVKEGVVVFAESQTRGRGRLGRKWLSPASRGLWFSVLLRPDLHPQEITQLTVASATALRRAIESLTGLKPQIKWPNDILVNGRKTAGILTELSAELDQVKYAILGIGGMSI